MMTMMLQLLIRHVQIGFRSMESIHSLRLHSFLRASYLVVSTQVIRFLFKMFTD